MGAEGSGLGAGETPRWGCAHSGGEGKHRSRFTEKLALWKGKGGNFRIYIRGNGRGSPAPGLNTNARFPPGARSGQASKLLVDPTCFCISPPRPCRCPLSRNTRACCVAKEDLGLTPSPARSGGLRTGDRTGNCSPLEVLSEVLGQRAFHQVPAGREEGETLPPPGRAKRSGDSFQVRTRWSLGVWFLQSKGTRGGHLSLFPFREKAASVDRDGARELQGKGAMNRSRRLWHEAHTALEGWQL